MEIQNIVFKRKLGLGLVLTHLIKDFGNGNFFLYSPLL